MARSGTQQYSGSYKLQKSRIYILDRLTCTLWNYLLVLPEPYPVIFVGFARLKPHQEQQYFLIIS